MYLLANAPMVPDRTNERMANGTDNRSKMNFTEK
jgi:hypothetical protein